MYKWIFIKITFCIKLYSYWFYFQSHQILRVLIGIYFIYLFLLFGNDLWDLMGEVCQSVYLYTLYSGCLPGSCAVTSRSAFSILSSNFSDFLVPHCTIHAVLYLFSFLPLNQYLLNTYLWTRMRTKQKPYLCAIYSPMEIQKNKFLYDAM
jgi:hypothetical protein